MRGGYALDRGAVLRRELLGRVTNEDPLRRILPLVNVALEDLSPRMQELYAPIRRPSISPEKLLRALLLQAFNSVRSERQLIEQLKYNLLFRCSPRTATVKVFFSDEHFLVGRTLIKAFASMKTFKPRTRAPTGTGGSGSGAQPLSATTSTRERRRNSTHALTTDADTPLFRKGSGNGQNTSRHSAIDHAGYAVSQRLRKRIEKAFGWIRTTNGLCRTRRPGQAGSLFTPTAAACNLVRLPKLLAARGFRR